MEEIKQKAQQFYGKYASILMMNTNPKYHSSKMIKQCALIAVDEIIEEVGKWKNTYMGKDQYKHWQLVREELKHL